MTAKIHALPDAIAISWIWQGSSVGRGDAKNDRTNLRLIREEPFAQKWRPLLSRQDPLFEHSRRYLSLTVEASSSSFQRLESSRSICM